jgi:hypothetical protein
MTTGRQHGKYLCVGHRDEIGIVSWTFDHHFMVPVALYSDTNTCSMMRRQSIRSNNRILVGNDTNLPPRCFGDCSLYNNSRKLLFVAGAERASRVVARQPVDHRYSGTMLLRPPLALVRDDDPIAGHSILPNFAHSCVKASTCLTSIPTCLLKLQPANLISAQLRRAAHSCDKTRLVPSSNRINLECQPRPTIKGNALAVFSRRHHPGAESSTQMPR